MHFPEVAFNHCHLRNSSEKDHLSLRHNQKIPFVLAFLRLNSATVTQVQPSCISSHFHPDDVLLWHPNVCALVSACEGGWKMYNVEFLQVKIDSF